MLEQNLKQLVEDFQFDPPSEKDEKQLMHLKISPTLTISFKELEPGLFLTAPIGPCPKEKREDLFILLMRANFLGQGTGGGAISLNDQENFLTLSLAILYDMNYRAFKEHVEDFVNYIDYWKEELTRHELAAKSILE